MHSGATIISLAPSNSQLAKRAHYTLAAEHDEGSMIHLPMVSRILLLLLIDVLAVGVSLNRSSPFAELQRQAKRVILTHIASLHGESANDKITAEGGNKAERSTHGEQEVTLSPNVISHIE